MKANVTLTLKFSCGPLRQDVTVVYFRFILKVVAYRVRSNGINCRWLCSSAYANDKKKIGFECTCCFHFQLSVVTGKALILITEQNVQTLTHLHRLVYMLHACLLTTKNPEDKPIILSGILCLFPYTHKFLQLLRAKFSHVLDSKKVLSCCTQCTEETTSSRSL